MWNTSLPDDARDLGSFPLQIWTYESFLLISSDHTEFL
jgi:hypothetical protein